MPRDPNTKDHYIGLRKWRPLLHYPSLTKDTAFPGLTAYLFFPGNQKERSQRNDRYGRRQPHRNELPFSLSHARAQYTERISVIYHSRRDRVRSIVIKLHVYNTPSLRSIIIKCWLALFLINNRIFGSDRRILNRVVGRLVGLVRFCLISELGSVCYV